MAWQKKSAAPFLQANQQHISQDIVRARAVLGDGITINTYGEVVVSLTFPFDAVEEHGVDIMRLRRLIGLPVTVSFQVWEDFDEYINPDGATDSPSDTPEEVAS